MLLSESRDLIIATSHLSLLTGEAMDQKIEKLLGLIRGQIHGEVRLKRWEDGEKTFINQMEALNKQYPLIVTARKNAEFKIIMPNIKINWDYDDKTSVEMGEYLLWFKWEHWSSCFNIYFKSYHIDRWGRRRITHSHHPHINQGRPCRGDFERTWNQLRTSNQISTLVTLSKQFLELYNPENPYHGIHYYTPIDIKIIDSNENVQLEYKWEGQNKCALMMEASRMGLELSPNAWDMLTIRCKEVADHHECNMEQAWKVLFQYMFLFRNDIRHRLWNLERQQDNSTLLRLRELRQQNGHYFRCIKGIYLTQELSDRLRQSGSISNVQANNNINDLLELTPCFIDEIVMFNERNNTSSLKPWEFYPDKYDMIMEDVRRISKDASPLVQECEYYIRRRYLAWLYDESERIKNEVVRYSPNGKQNSLFTEQVEAS